MVHNLNIDKVEVHEKTSFLSSYPHEVPCLGLMSALLNYQKLSDEVRGIYSSMGQFDLASYQLVHLKNLTDRKGDIAETFGFHSSSLDLPLLDDIGFKKASTQGGKPFGSSVQDILIQ